MLLTVSNSDVSLGLGRRSHCGPTRVLRAPARPFTHEDAASAAEILMPLFFYRLELSPGCGQKKIVYKFKSEPPMRSFPCKGVGIGQTQIEIISIKFFDTWDLLRFMTYRDFWCVTPERWVCGVSW